jgi:DNA-binding NtrC family response regulator
MSALPILVVDDQEAHRDLMGAALGAAGYEVVEAGSGHEALAQLARGSFGLVLTDQLMPGMSGLELMVEIFRLRPGLPVVIVTAYGTVDTAVQAMKAGAVDYIQKPFSPDELLIVVRRVLEREALQEEVRALRAQVGEPYRFHRLVSNSPAMLEIFERIRNLADLDTTVLITGETGTGKELVAHAIHYNSHRRERRFVSINCAALSETLLESELFGHERGAFSGAVQARRGKFEYAAGGTVLLDEVGDIPLVMQVKLLRVLQEKEIQRVGGNESIPVDVRVLAATNRNLEEAVSDGAFRADLFYRLNVVRIELPPLRSRMEDVPWLAEHFLRSFREKTGRSVHCISREAMGALLGYDWPGNVRELANVVERAAVSATGDEVTAVDLTARPPRTPLAEPSPFDFELPLKLGRQRIVADYERAYLSEWLGRLKGNMQLCAQKCGIDAKTLYRKMQEYGLDKRDFKS